MSEEKPPPTLADLLEAQRKTYALVLEVQRELREMRGTGKQPKLISGGVAKKANPEFALLRAQLLKAWAELKGHPYSFDGKDARAIGALLKRGVTPAEATVRWREAIKQGCGSIHLYELNFSKWVPSTTNNRPTVKGDIYAEKKPNE
ncbi:MAG: hypothetical protein SFW67_28560 [Myxococcaceae bacterium]|nr:hypothetical protein [Myxococcaceae bacterium]